MSEYAERTKLAGDTKAALAEKLGWCGYLIFTNVTERYNVMNSQAESQDGDKLVLTVEIWGLSSGNLLTVVDLGEREAALVARTPTDLARQVYQVVREAREQQSARLNSKDLQSV